MEIRALSFNDGNDLGSVAYDAYLTLAKRYNWSLSAASSFEPRRLLFAEDVTSEGYSVWFVAHSNFISEEDTNGLWKNTFKKDLLLEEWFPEALKKHNPKVREPKRIVFAKKASGKYYFIGVYEVDRIEKNDDGNYVRFFQKISTKYPE